jgi:glycosyltransferase involved in cell wall biosynthesis
MKILQIYNERSDWGGEDAMVEASIEVLRANNREVSVWIVRNSDFLDGLLGKVRAFFGGIYSIKMYALMRKKLRDDKPDIVHAHNLYPIFSPSVLKACSQEKIPVVVHCHNHFLTCPIGTHLRKGKVCEKCTAGSSIPCVWFNCRDSFFESLAYALRYKIARSMRWYHKYATRLIVMTEWSKKRLVEAGFGQDKIEVLPNVVSIPEKKGSIGGDYVLFVGRLSEEKGVSILLDAAVHLPNISFIVVGDGPDRTFLEIDSLANVTFLGWQTKSQLDVLYDRARMVVVPSICYETFGLVAAEAMAHSAPVIGSRLGGLAEVILENETGLLYEAGNAAMLIEKILLIWENIELGIQYGNAGFSRASMCFSDEAYFERLDQIYNQIQISE